MAVLRACARGGRERLYIRATSLYLIIWWDVSGPPFRWVGM